MISHPRILLASVTTFVLLFAGCSKKETLEVDNETQSVVDHVIADQEFISILPSVYQSILSNKSGTLVTCDTLSLISDDTKDTLPNKLYSLTLSNCPLLMKDGKPRSGKLIIRIKGLIQKPGSQIIIKLMDYTAGGIHYMCDSLTAVTKLTGTLFITFDVNLFKGVCKTNTYTINHSFSRTMAHYESGNPSGTGAVSYFYGSSNGINRKGINFSTMAYQERPLVKHRDCPYIDKGRMDITPQGFKMRVIDFGNGECDTEATFTVNENTVAFKLK